MAVPPIKIAHLLQYSVERASTRWQMLALLATLNGALTSLVFGPAYMVMDQVMSVAGTEADGSSTGNSAMDVLSDGFSTLIWGHIAVTLINAALLVPWARAIASNDLIPVGGSPGALIQRSFRAFFHLLLASILTGIAIVAGGFILFSLANTVGFLAMVLVLAGGFSLVWISVLVNAIANFCVLCEAQDKPLTLATGWQVLKPNASPAAATLALFWVASMIGSILIGGLLGDAGNTFYRFSLMISSTFSFAATAMHISGLAFFDNNKR